MADALRTRDHLRAVLMLGLPLIGSHLAQFAIHVVDIVMLGWYSVEALAAGVLGTSFFFVVFILGAGFAGAVMPLAASAAAAGDEAEVRRVTRMGLWASLAFALTTVPLMWFSGAILRALGQDAGLAAGAEAYLRIAGFGVGPALVVMVLKSTLAALERTQAVLWLTVAAAGVNAAINWALIFGNWGAPEMGLRGAAIASVLVQGLGAAGLIAYAGLQPDLRRYTLFVRLWRPDPSALARVFRMGVPVGLTGVAEGGLFSATALMMGWIGTTELAAHGIAVQIGGLTFMLHLGLSNAATVRAGRAHGLGDGAGLRHGAAVALALSFVIALAIMAAMLLVPEFLIGLFLDPAEPQRAAILAFGTTLLAVAALFQLADAGQVMAVGLLRGVHDTRVPLVIAVAGYWGLGVPSAWALGFVAGFGGPGIWFGLVIGLGAVAAALGWRFWRRARAA